MRKLFKTISLSFSLALLGFVISANVFAQSSIARVTSVTGDAFVKMGEKLIPLKKSQEIYDSNIIITAVGAQVIFNDFFDHVYHLAGEGQILIRPQVIQLHRGYFWIQSRGKDQQIFQVTTANAKLYYSHGQGVLSFDSFSGRTQFISIQGHFGFGNLLQPELDVKVSTSEFSFVDSEFQDGVPRQSTSIGQQTFKQVASLFPEIKIDGKLASDQDQPVAAPSRAPASVVQNKTGTVTFIPIKHDLAQTKPQRQKMLESYTSKPKGRAPASVSKTTQAPRLNSNVEIKVFGGNTKLKSSTTAVQASASAAPSSAQGLIQSSRTPASLGAQSDVFEKGLQQHYENQQPHSNEVNQLLRELKNYQMDLSSGF